MLSGPAPTDTRRDGSARLCISEAAAEAPRRAALIEQDGTVHSFESLASRAADVAERLRASGVRPEDGQTRVAFVATPSLQTALVLYALLELEVCAVPVHPKLTFAEREDLLARMRPTLSLDAPAMAELVAPAPRPRRPRSGGAPRQFGGASKPLAIVCTSGSSGTPKGVVLSRGAFVAAADASAANLGWHDGDRWLLCMPPAHVGGLSIFIRTLLARRCTVLAGDGSFDPVTMTAVARQQRVTLMSLVPTMLSRLLESGVARSALASLRALLLGGAAAPEPLLARASAAGLPVLTTYGLTETCGQVTTERPGRIGDAPRGAGPPLPGMQVRIRDAEIQVRGPTLLSGWFPPESAPRPLTDDGWLHTGDAGAIDARGRLHVTGRLDARIVTGGENVDPAEVERVLESCPGVARACVFGVPDGTWGAVVAAALVGDGPEAFSWSEARTRLAPHKRPRLVAWLPSLPQTPSGKIDRRATLEHATPYLEPVRE